MLPWEINGISTLCLWSMSFQSYTLRKTNIQKISNCQHFFQKEVTFPYFETECKFNTSLWVPSLWNILHRECLSFPNDHLIPFFPWPHLMRTLTIKLCFVHWEANRMLVQMSGQNFEFQFHLYCQHALIKIILSWFIICSSLL